MLAPAANPVNIAIVGVGNCASSLVQGLTHYREGANSHVGLMHWTGRLSGPGHPGHSGLGTYGRR
jgi:myo-inositol-1-phosphate synthase